MYAPDVAASFAREYQDLELRTPRREALNHLVAANAATVMRATKANADRYLKRNAEGVNARYVRAVAACSELARGEIAAARDRMRGIQPERLEKLSRENAIISATVYAVGAGRALQALDAAEAMLSGELSAERFVLDWGSFAGIALPNKDAPGYWGYKANAIAQLERDCFEVQEPFRARNHRQLRGAIAELIYNEAASMLVVLPAVAGDSLGNVPGSGDGSTLHELKGSASAVERWLSHVAIGLFIVYAKLMPDLLPAELTEEQKQWQREVAYGAYRRCKRLARNLLAPGDLESIKDSPAWAPTPTHEKAHRQLYAQLLDAEIVVMGYISTR